MEVSRSGWAALTLAIALVGACKFDRTGVGGDDGDDIAIDASAIDADPTAPDAEDPDANTTTCVPGCSGSELTSCPSGTTMDCALGCSIVGTPHCLAMTPSNGASFSSLDDVTADLAGIADHILVISSTDGVVYDYNVTTMGLATVRAAGPDVISGIRFTVVGAYAVVAVDTLDIDGDAGLIVEGSRPLILLSRGAVTIDGWVDVAGGCFFGNSYVRSCAGPGGGAGATTSVALAGGCGPGGNNVYLTAAGGQESGAGGGAMAQAGASSGATLALGVGLGGVATACPDASLVPLAGGSGGGAARLNDANNLFAVGGGGGGALQISSQTSITLASVAGSFATIDASGAGGAVTNTDNGGGGGGSGGAVLLEAPVVTFDDAGIYAGGGGGGAGRPPVTPGVDAPTDGNGEAGQWFLLAAAGGVGGSASGNDGRGGTGGIATEAPAAGDGGQDGTGAGGGGAGRLRVNTQTGSTSGTGFETTAFFSTGLITLD